MAWRHFLVMLTGYFLGFVILAIVIWWGSDIITNTVNPEKFTASRGEGAFGVGMGTRVTKSLNSNVCLKFILKKFWSGNTEVNKPLSCLLRNFFVPLIWFAEDWYIEKYFLHFLCLLRFFAKSLVCRTSKPILARKSRERVNKMHISTKLAV